MAKSTRALNPDGAGDQGTLYVYDWKWRQFSCISVQVTNVECRETASPTDPLPNGDDPKDWTEPGVEDEDCNDPAP